MELTSSIQDSSLKTQETLGTFQNELGQLRLQMVACSCSKGKFNFFLSIVLFRCIRQFVLEPIRLKPSVVDSEQLQQNIVTKPNGKRRIILEFENFYHLRLPTAVDLSTSTINGQFFCSYFTSFPSFLINDYFYSILVDVKLNSSATV